MNLKANPTAHLVLTFSFLLLLGSAEMTKAQTVSVWLTTESLSSTLQPQASVTFATNSGGSNPIYVDETQTYQQIEGFGASFTDSTGYLLNSVASLVIRTNAMNSLFSRNGTNCIGLSFMRNPMGASDIARTQYTYDDMAAGKSDVNLTNFSIAHDQVDIIPLLQQALALNPDLKLMASPWSPPAWMKSTNSMVGGTLVSSNYSVFARYLVRYIQAYAAAGIPTHYISLQNEPLYLPGDYPGMSMPAATQITIMRDYVLPTFAASNITTKVLVYDHNYDQLSYPQTVFADATLLASTNVAGTAWHGYGGTPGSMLTAGNQFPTKGNWVTEHSSMTSDGIRFDFGNVIHALRCGAKSYVKWSLALDQNNGPHLGGCGSCKPFVTYNTSTAALSYSSDFYAMGHFSKFILPGAYRIFSANANGVVSAAFKNPDGSKALVCFNDTTSSKTFQVRWGSQSFSYTLPYYAGATFTWSGTQTGSYTVSATNQIQTSSFNRVSGLQTEWTSDSVGGFDLAYTANSLYAVYKNVDFSASPTNVTMRLAGFGGANYLDFHLDSQSGTLISSIAAPNTGNWQVFTNVSGTVANASGLHDLYLVCRGGSSLANMNSFQFGSVTSAPPVQLPSPWVTADIGAVAATGVASYDSGTFTVFGSGADIETTADEFRYVYQTSTGDCSIVARVATQSNTDPWAKAGVMIRESTAAGSINAAVLLTPGNGVTFQRRTSTGGSTTATIVGGVTVPRWVKLVRTGNSFAAYYSPDGVAWTQIGTSQTITMASSATLGLAVTSHNDGTLGAAMFDNVATGAPAAPTGLTASPGNAQVTLNWSASAGATGYKVKRATVSGGPYTSTNTASGVTFTNTGLVNGTTYYYVLSATNGFGEGTNSAQVSATPLIVTFPPVITNGPSSVSVNVSNNANFTVGVTGDTPLVYQWRFNGANISSATTNAYTLTNVQATNAGAYTVVITNVSGSVTSSPATLTVTFPPVITNQPVGVSASLYSDATFTVGVTGDAPLAYQWRVDGMNIYAATTNAYTVFGVQAADAGAYTVVITNASGSVTSSVAMLTVALPPVITNQPASVSVNVSNNATFTVGVTGDAPLAYQWFFNTTTAVGQNTNTLTLANVQATNVGAFTVVITNASGSVTSTLATLTVTFPPVITNQPASVWVSVSNNATFTVGVTGDAPLVYRWRFNGTNISGATTNACTLTDVQATNAGSYTVVITNGSGSVTSAVATLTVNTPPLLAAISNQTVVAGATLVVSNSASDADVPLQTLSFNLLSAPAGASINTNSGVFTWRPAIAQAPSTQAVGVVVSDSGVPVLSATQNFTVTVIRPANPTLSAASMTNGQLGFWITGDTGPDCTILSSTNLTSWSPVFTTNSPVLPFYWTDTNSPALPAGYYRVLLGP
ncbi:MAG: immunoglobulin domain-containing protein [Verrucomicrobiota bacterium]